MIKVAEVQKALLASTLLLLPLPLPLSPPPPPPGRPRHAEMGRINCWHVKTEK